MSKLIENRIKMVKPSIFHWAILMEIPKSSTFSYYSAAKNLNILDLLKVFMNHQAYLNFYLQWFLKIKNSNIMNENLLKFAGFRWFIEYLLAKIASFKGSAMNACFLLFQYFGQMFAEKQVSILNFFELIRKVFI